jgi:hypothetical protein
MSLLTGAEIDAMWIGARSFKWGGMGWTSRDGDASPRRGARHADDGRPRDWSDEGVIGIEGYLLVRESASGE